MTAQQQFGTDVTIIGIPSLAGEAEMQEFVADTGTEVVTHIPDPDGVLWSHFGVTSHSTYVYVNDDGTWRTSGYGSLIEDVEALIAS